MSTTTSEKIRAHLEPLIRKAETGEQWAEICRLEAEMLAHPEKEYRAQDILAAAGLKHEGTLADGTIVMRLV